MRFTPSCRSIAGVGASLVAAVLSLLSFVGASGCASATPATTDNPALTTGCKATGPDGQPAANGDGVARLLAMQTECPPDVLAVRAALAHAGARSSVTMVDNRGFHSTLGSFSFFEIVTGSIGGTNVENGELFFGHFVSANGDALSLDKEPGKGALMVELVAWDPGKGVYDFYELIGDGVHGKWFYRGDSRDIADDVAKLHVQANPSQPEFGGRLRCSGCHVNGGPIMKELDAPHNDWWTSARPLPFAGRSPDADVTNVLGAITDADALSVAVRAGSGRLAASASFAAQLAARPLREQLRPLFCPQEINFASDPEPTDPPSGSAPLAAVTIPAGFLVDSRLSAAGVVANGAAALPLAVPRAFYDAALVAVKSKFPESTAKDADHAWLGPIKAASDGTRIDALVSSSLVDEELVADVLAVDLTNPALSAARCGLLRLVPEKAAAGWRDDFALRVAAAAASNDAAAKELQTNLVDPSRTAASHGARARAFVTACQAKAADPASGPTHVASLVRLLAQRRVEVAANEISKNPRGQITEPGFRVIFPVTIPAAQPGALRLTEACDVVP